MNKPAFERLISLEEEELGPPIDGEQTADLGSYDKGYCRVPMVGPSGSSIHNRHGRAMAGTASPNVTPIHITIGSRHLQINPEQMKYLSLITLTIQNAALNLTMRAARTQSEKFSTSVAVTVAEIFKLITCIFFLWYEDNFSIARTCESIRSQIIHNYYDTMKVAVPSLVYYVQNNLLYVGSTHLDAATGQVIYQLKILTTAIFSVTMLGRRLSKLQWVSLVVLFIGVAMIETLAISESQSTKKSQDHTFPNETKHDIDDSVKHVDNPSIGFIAVLIACCLSGFAGVYFEKILKNSSHISLWIRNIQLSSLSIPFGLFQVLVVDYNHLTTKGMWYGFTPLTWLCIILQVQGGLLVAIVVKFANNILKGFATSMAIVISTLASMFFFQFHLTPTFICGASLVIGSVMMYNK